MTLVYGALVVFGVVGVVGAGVVKFGVVAFEVEFDPVVCAFIGLVIKILLRLSDVRIWAGLSEI